VLPQYPWTPDYVFAGKGNDTLRFFNTPVIQLNLVMAPTRWSEAAVA